MSTETNIHFRCGACGHDRIVSLQEGVTVASNVIAVHERDCEGQPNPMAAMSGYKLEGGRDAGYACGGCHLHLADTSAALFRYLQERGMVGEWREVDE